MFVDQDKNLNAVRFIVLCGIMAIVLMAGALYGIHVEQKQELRSAQPASTAGPSHRGSQDSQNEKQQETQQKELITPTPGIP